MATGRERERKLKGERSRRQKALPRIQRDTAAEVKKLLRRAGRDVCAALAGAPSEFDAFLLPRLQASIRQALERLGAGAGAVAGDGASRAWRAGIDLIDGPLDAALGLDAPAFRISAILPQVDARQLLAMRGFLTHKMSGVATALADRINTELGLTMIGTRNVGDTVRRVADILGKGGRSRALTVVRTELGRAYSIAAHERQAQAAKVLPGLRKEWRRSGKLHSRPAHDAADGQIKDIDEPFEVGGVKLMFPRDPAGPPGETVNCGCQSLPWMERWEIKSPA